MQFTYKGYAKLCGFLRDNGYSFSFFDDYKTTNKICIMRHDVDLSLEKAYEFSQFESSMGLKSSYFVLLNTSFYNIFDSYSRKIVHNILSCGHKVGLHFDETKYKYDKEHTLTSRISEEVDYLSMILGTKVDVISMHRPSKETLEANYVFPDFLNTYSKEFFCDYKYVSDSRMCWREDVEKIILSEAPNSIQLLTHPIWYNKNESNMHDILLELIRDTAKERYNMLNKSTRNLSEVITIDEIVGMLK